MRDTQKLSLAAVCMVVIGIWLCTKGGYTLGISLVSGGIFYFVTSKEEQAELDTYGVELSDDTEKARDDLFTTAVKDGE